MEFSIVSESYTQFTDLLSNELESLVLPDTLISLPEDRIEWLTTSSMEIKGKRRHCKCCHLHL